MADLVGQQLGNYRLSRLIGQGGFADVYLGEHTYLKTQAAIKVLQLSDFRIALLAQSSRSQDTHQMAGTVSYMAPEQIQGKPRPASDQYSLGIVVYEWLSGDRPFHGSMTAIATQQILTPPPPLYQKVPTILPAIEEVVMIALAKDPVRRFTSVQAFATALEQACRSEPLASPVPRSGLAQLLAPAGDQQ